MKTCRITLAEIGQLQDQNEHPITTRSRDNLPAHRSVGMRGHGDGRGVGCQMDRWLNLAYRGFVRPVALNHQRSFGKWTGGPNRLDVSMVINNKSIYGFRHFYLRVTTMALDGNFGTVVAVLSPDRVPEWTGKKPSSMDCKGWPIMWWQSCVSISTGPMMGGKLFLSESAGFFMFPQYGFGKCVRLVWCDNDYPI